MVALRDPQHERACQHLAAGFRLSAEERAERGLSPDASLTEEAAAIGGLDPAASSFKANARKFRQRKAIADRVAEIQYAGAALASTSVGSLIVEAEAVRAGAMTKKEFAAANSAIVTKAQLAGLWRSKVEASGPGGAPLPAAPAYNAPTIIMMGAPQAVQSQPAE